jgi:hypothetical protein
MDNINMKEVEITYENLFKLIAEEEGISYEIGEEYFQSTPIEIPDENNNWIPVKGLIKKEAEAVNIDLGTHKLMCAAKHLISNDVTMVMADELKVDGMIIGYNDVVHFINNIIKLDGKHTVYDMEVDSDTHLYQCALGIIHHNTLLTSAIIEYANKLNMRTITIVPSSSLLKQTHDYIKQFEIPVGMFGAGKKDDAPNIVATWQTLQNNKTFIRDFECVIWDEVHGAKAFIAQQIMNQAANSFMRIGLTGTIPKDPLDKANLTAGFGPVTFDVKAYELQERNILSSIHISIFKLEYPKEYINSFVDWHDETTFLQTNEMFLTFVMALLPSLEGNTLILMKNIDPTAELSELLGCTFISSKLNVDKRQEKFNEFVYGENHTAAGTYSLLSTGIDIVHINNMILGPTPGKSFVKTIQSIGRGLRRKGGEKEHVNVIDLTSNLKFDRKHIKSRKDYYVESRYPFEEDKMDVGQFRLSTPKKK